MIFWGIIFIEISYSINIRLYTCIQWTVIWTRDQILRYLYIIQSSGFFLTYHLEVTYTCTCIWTQNMMKMSPWDIWRDAEVRSGEIFVCCSQISGHQSGFLYVQELKPSNSCTAITWCDWMFYRDLVRYLCFVTRYQVICWDNGTSIYWYLLFECDMFHVLYINS